jgi:hypothetical protein
MTTRNFRFIADGSGKNLSFVVAASGQSSIDNVRAFEVLQEQQPKKNVKEFLSGNMDDSREIIMRADTQHIQLMGEFETFANPLAIVTRLQRGSLVKCFVAFGDDDFYELEGTATKGVSIIKIHSQNRDEITTPPIAREIRVSWRDSSKQLCRLTQGEIIFLPTTMSMSE